MGRGVRVDRDHLFRPGLPAHQVAPVVLLDRLEFPGVQPRRQLREDREARQTGR